jgi:lipoprotein-releasing system ATP-binding protein
MIVLSASQLKKTYRLGRVDVPVLRGVGLEVEPGEFVAVVGASGSGKSTLLHLLGGLDRPDPGSGPVAFNGRPLASLSRRELDAYRATHVGFVFQFYHLLPELSVIENVMIAGMVRHGRMGYMRHASAVRAEALRLLEGFGLSPRLSHRPAELSGGERQRVAIARALVNQPDVLLADEPTGNLDRVTGNKILDALGDVRRSRRQTVVMVTHDAEVAARADRQVRLVDGRVE